jgi:prepilin-type N-terminal cleavage/methylation domain-containing protein
LIFFQKLSFPVDVMPSFLRQRSRTRYRNRAFTLIEVLLVGALVGILSMVLIRSMFKFSEQRKLRTAAVELSGFLQVARNVASAVNAPCTIDLANETGGDFRHISSPSCGDGSMPPRVGLGGASGSRDIKAGIIRGSYPLTFTPDGTLKNGATVRLSSSNVPDGAWCVDVQEPLATVRLGWQQGDAACNYGIEQ